ncbi:unnamed protein product [Cylicocyclus nassatus]|uniref:Uncharacterized protein n=1 Tax=Cylicocyclus nassatus TaxID=53992 RepID=A0AA36HDP9_CYLNA|nr:unnamed protein product [Cylicocyclus nassatus]
MLWVSYVLKSTQCCFLIIAIYVYVYLATIIWRKMVYNSNLTLLLLFLPIPSIVGTSMYSLRDITVMLKMNTATSNQIIQTILDLGMSGGVLNLPNLIVDRLAATFYPAQYETKGGEIPWIAVGMITSQVLLTGGFVAMVKIGIISELVSTMTFIALCIISAVLFTILPHFSRKYHDYYRKRQSSVSVRYQSVENLRAAKLLKVLVVVYVFFYLSETGIFSLFYFIIADEDKICSITLQTFFNLVVIIEILTSINVIARSHPSLRRALPAFCRRQEVRATYVTTCDVRSYDGKALSFSVNCQREMYFDQLQDSWGEKK